MSSDAGEFEFGPFRIDSSERLLHRGDELIPLPPKAADTLLALLSSAGRMVDKDELLKTVWPDTFVEEGSLTRNISLLRKTLGDAHGDPKGGDPKVEAVYIETIPRRGYRFVAPVRTGNGQPASPAPIQALTAAPRRPLIGWRWAVLAVASILAAGTIAGYLIQTRRPTDRPAATAEQKRLAREAYDHGRDAWNRRTPESLRQARQYFEQATADDPDYAPAYSGLADSYSLLGSIGTDGMPPTEAMPIARKAAQKAISLDPGLAEAHASLAYVNLSWWDLKGAADEFSKAMELNPEGAAGATAHQWYSHYFMATGNLEKAKEQMEIARRLQPNSPIIKVGMGWCWYYAQDYDRAIKEYQTAVDMDETFAMAHQTLGMAYQQKGLLDKAIGEFREAVDTSGHGPAAVAALAAAYGAANNKTRAEEGLQELAEMKQHRYVPALYFAQVHLALDEIGDTIKFGLEAYNEHSDYLLYLPLEPRMSRIRKLPAVMEILRRVKQ